MLSLKKILLGFFVILLLLVVFFWYREPAFMLEMADQVWNCF